ncbi:hypothetical protein BLA60_15925 [Actinophytocola xinjiangensis]|uniref:phospholipase D n=1 Tax=Actinophytocola xinjiangensis TaxID=485602 RepID=A0A7Z1AZ73_9PSEU|nr:phospholipase D-like domain-containing protein [Actinophytocola xinjiangensis]OLF10656.1 hypothetical protein BLA60_15925 [Actinophytocola xinjiangensis]
MRRNKLYAIGLVAALTATLTTVGPAVAQNDVCPAEQSAPVDTAAVQSGLTYNNPDTGKRDDIAERIVYLICGTERGETIDVAAHMFAHTDIATALMEMAHRDVRVRIIVDRGAATGAEPHNYSEFERVKSSFDNSPGSTSWITTCELGSRACIGGGGGEDYDPEAKMHNKFLLFSRTRGTDKVVLQTSHNFKSGGSGTGMWNSAYTVADEPRVYDHYARYFEYLIAGEQHNDFYNMMPPSNLGKYSVYHSPRASGNTLLDILNRVDCTKTSDTGGTDPGNYPIVRVAVWNISGTLWESTGTVLARKLKAMDDQGCYVDVIVDKVGKGAGGNDGPLEALLRKPKGDHHGPEVREFYANSSKGGLHSKDILIDGYFDGKPDQKVVFTGTFNFTGRSVRVSDETQLEIRDAAVHDAFRSYFFEARQAASLTWQTSKFKR